jgi:hypothetical protein
MKSCAAAVNTSSKKIDKEMKNKDKKKTFADKQGNWQFGLLGNIYS